MHLQRFTLFLLIINCYYYYDY
ncbi:hypothetical protein CXB51_016866 [Gossypium anomalum]|uniref:Uncharacterized protein n=1 Tax=Gossypium anomalum TaxID=47600 RepID=A0A8J6CVG6_9ROSI|nr:hypothetical protein CXB51_016866 [Gossypium anomalum]